MCLRGSTVDLLVRIEAHLDTVGLLIGIDVFHHQLMMPRGEVQRTLRRFIV